MIFVMVFALLQKHPLPMWFVHFCPFIFVLRPILTYIPLTSLSMGSPILILLEQKKKSPTPPTADCTPQVPTPEHPWPHAMKMEQWFFSHHRKRGSEVGYVANFNVLIVKFMKVSSPHFNICTPNCKKLTFGKTDMTNYFHISEPSQFFFYIIIILHLYNFYYIIITNSILFSTHLNYTFWFSHIPRLWIICTLNHNNVQVAFFLCRLQLSTPELSLWHSFPFVLTKFWHKFMWNYY